MTGRPLLPSALPLVIVNRWAGGARVCRDPERLRVAFARRGLDVDLAETCGPGHATELARRCGSDLVVAVGGDGTVHEVIDGLDLSRQRLGVVPAGSGNDFAWQHGVPRRLADAVDRIAAGRERRVDLGRWEGGRFHNNLGLGFEAAVNRHSQRLGRVRGAARYFVALGRALGELRTWELDLQWEGGAFAGPLSSAALLNGRRVGGAFRLAPAARSDDGVLDLVLAVALGRWSLLAALGPVLGGREPRDQRIRRARTGWLQMKAAEPVPVYADGEYAGEHRTLQARVLPGALRLV